MNDKPSPSRWSSAFLGACLSIFIGSVLLLAAVRLIERIAVPLVIGTLVASTAWLVWTWRRRPPSEW